MAKKRIGAARSDAEGKDSTRSKATGPDIRALSSARKLDAIGRLAPIFTHDFNNVLTAIVGHLELAERKLGDRPQEAARIRKAIAAAFQGRAITQQLLVLSGRQSTAGPPVDVAASIHSVKELAATLGRETRVRIPAPIWTVAVDGGRLETVLLNLAMAVEEGPPESEGVRIAVRNRPPDAEGTDRDHVCISVSAPGPATPSSRGKRNTSDRHSAQWALALDAAADFARQSGGRAELHRGTGSTIECRLLLPRSQKEEAGQSATAARQHEIVRVLLVEDEDNVRDISRHALSELGFSVTEACNGDDAVELLRRGSQFELLFTDIVMPGHHTGVDVAEVARDMLPDIKILFTSGFPRQSLRDRTAEIAAAPFIPKPFRYDDLKKQLESLLG